MKAKLPDNDSNLALLEDFVDVEIVVTDLDGTLIDGTDSIKDNIRKKKKYMDGNHALEKARK